MQFEEFNDQERYKLRFEAACAALTGLLADTEDRADEIRTEVQEIDGVKKKVALETCAEATARLAVEHADALLKALK